MTRVENALKNRLPVGAVLSLFSSKADVIVIHVIGYPETVEAVDTCRRLGQQYILIQYCMRSTQKPNIKDWLPLWRDALVVWSYYDLAALAREDGVDLDSENVNVYESPLGVDAAFAKERTREYSRRFVIATSGYVAASECVEEAAGAVEMLGGQSFHLGPKFENLKSHVVFGHGLLDEELALVYSRCQFVAGLRRCEGFEMPAAEGLLCGARPILFDRPHYRRWYSRWGRFIPETGFNDVRSALYEEFRRGPGEITAEELHEARQLFNWDTIVRGLWERTGL